MQRVADSEDLDALRGRARQPARDETERPSFIAIRSHIAYPAPHAVDTAKSHGAPLGEPEVRATKEVMGFDPDRSFWVDERVYEHMSLRGRGAEAQGEWQERFQAWREASPELAADWDLRLGGAPARRLARGAARASRPVNRSPRARPVRRRWRRSARTRPTMVGGAADLVESTKTLFEGAGEFSRVHAGRNIPFGIREHAMGAIVNGAGRARRDRQAVRLDVPDLLRLHARRACGCRR